MAITGLTTIGVNPIKPPEIHAIWQIFSERDQNVTQWKCLGTYILTA